MERTKGVDGTVVFFPERMEVKWGGWRDFRVGKDTPCRVPPLWEKRSLISKHFLFMKSWKGEGACPACVVLTF